jgi:hypothetical protein
MNKNNIKKTPFFKNMQENDSSDTEISISNNDLNDDSSISEIESSIKSINTELSQPSLENENKSLDNTDLNNISSDCNVNLKTEFEKLNCTDENMYSTECNKFLLKKEMIESKCIEDTPYLYPNLNDPQFNVKIASKKEFNDTRYNGTVHKNIKEHADKLSKAEFELSPHQIFVKNFLSFQTPYNSLLLYHGLGSGKTCSSIGVCEEERDYMKQIGKNKRIIIVASENVQDNFKLQLFDERKLKLIDGVWNIRACVGNKLLKEINPMNMKGITKEKVISQIKNIINTYYIFLGYGQFANYIIRTMNYTEEEINLNKTKTINKRIINRLKREFEGRLIVIDEIHNIRKADDNENKKVAIYLELLVKLVQNMRLLLLSATPIYNNYKEIIWLLNLMNINDKRSKIEVSDVFDKNGNVTKKGEELLIRKATGYVSFVRGDDVYTFPYRVYPNIFAKEHTFPYISYPSYQMNLKKIKNDDKKRILNLYLNRIEECNNCGTCQYCSYKYIIYNLRNKNFTTTTKKGVVREMPNFENMETFGYTLLQIPLESLIISYPIQGLKPILENMEDTVYSEELSPSISEESLSKSISDDEEDLKQVSELTENNSEDEIANVSEIDDDLLNESLKQEQVSELTENNSEDEIANVSEIDDDNLEEDLEEELRQSQEHKNHEDQLGGVSTNSSPSNRYIDPHELTGKRGLSRVMDFVDEKSPPQKGNFEYKRSTIENYGKLFSQSIIGKYSSKIKCVLDCIFNPNTNNVSEGIVLIYSQYIDGGLIPMALALEEMGFTRYGENVKPLFKNRPSEIVDVRTMKPPTNKKDFMPARYSMITGDPRLSPNNDFEVKGLTNENNIYGNKIKVILISRAGSEGIDLKFIRQVHILDPWYNMNRPEQTIGRAVRNFSHKDLPFEQRNVQIYMHATILGKKNKEEAADLYIYRIAEFKATQIGKVTRILKETAVDCIINHDQTNFSQEMLSSELRDINIVQELSTGEVIEHFKIGDAPYSSACDYMKTCYYSCKPNKRINENDLNEDTYSEKFIVINSEKIMQRIRMLMKESYFYKKDVLIKSIRITKQYPLVQIYAALTQLIEDNNEFIVDRYGRNGRLVNIGEYYLFQPIELNDKNISIYDRYTPIDYKHSFINFDLSVPKERERERERERDNIPKNININANTNVLSNNNIYNAKIKKILDELNENLNITKEFMKATKISRGEDNWYKYCGIAIQNMSRNYPGIREYLLEFLVSHMVEMLLYSDKLEYMNYIYSLENINKEQNLIEYYSKKYFEAKSIITDGFAAFILYDLNKLKIMILNKNNVWVEAESEDKRDIEQSVEGKKALKFNATNYNNIVGFLGYDKQKRFLVFKTKNLNSSRDTGARCDEAGKEKTINKLNTILGETKYNAENTKLKKDEKGNIIQESISQHELCILQEFMLRYYNKIKKNNVKWFLTPEMALYYELYKV